MCAASVTCRVLPVAALLLFGCMRQTGAKVDPVSDPRVGVAITRVLGMIAARRGAGSLVRPDGYTYTIESAQLMLYAASAGDSALYRSLREHVVRHLITDDRSDPYTRGFVKWRHREGAPPDASGTTEGLRVAQALWVGGHTFADSADRGLALMVLRGYAQHGYEDQQIWFIRNYFNFATRSYATNTFLVDYDPDFVHSVATETGDSALGDLAERSYRLVRSAVAPSGLIYEIIQPEVLTALPALEGPAFGPNDVVSLLNSCTVAERVVSRAPEIGRGVLRHARRKHREFAVYYYGRSGEAVREGDMETGTLSCLVRLSVRLNDRKSRNVFLDQLLNMLSERDRRKDSLDLYTATEALLALNLAGVIDSARPAGARP